MNKAAFVCLFLVLLSTPIFSADLTYTLDDEKVDIHLNFLKPIGKVLVKEDQNRIIAKFQTTDNVDISQEFWGVPLAKVYGEHDGKTASLIFEFIDVAVMPDIQQSEKTLDLKFTFIKSQQQSYSSGSVYFRLVVGLLFTVICILVIYWFAKMFLKKNLSTEIPGVGRGLGKVDIMPGKSLFFYELGDIIYILGLSGDQISLIDKICDEDEINKIKAGFSRKTDFTSYLKYFSKGDMDKEVDVTSTIIRDKVNSLKKK